MYTWKQEYQNQIRLSGDKTDEIYRHSNKCLIDGHRGAKALRPENTIPSFEYAIELGVDTLETDVRLTKDGIPVLCHDSDIVRTTNGEGIIRQYTLEELKQFDAGSKFGSGEFANKGFKIPTLEEFCELIDAHREILLNVEIKDYGLECIDRTMATIGAFNLLGNCVFTCFNASVIHYMYERYGVKTQGFLGKHMRDFRPGMKGTYSELYAIGVEMGDLTKECVENLNYLDIQPWCWCCDDEETVRYALECGATLVTCNDPRAALRIIGK